MTRLLLLVLSAALALVAPETRGGCECPAGTVSTNGETIVFGDAHFAVQFDRASLTLRGISTDGRTVLRIDRAHPVTLLPNRADASRETALPPDWKGIGLTRVNDSTVRMTNRCGDWMIDTLWELMPANRRVKRTFDVTWLGEGKGVLTSLWVNHGTLHAGGYQLPRSFPPIARDAAECRASRAAVTQSNVSPSVVVADDGGGMGLFVCTDETRPYADRVNLIVREYDNAFGLATLILAKGFCARGQPQRLGDVYLQLVPGGRPAALEAVRGFFTDLRLAPPADTPDWMKDLVLYSTHPTGPVEYGRFARTGLKGKTAFLSELAALGVTCIWLQPLTDRPDGDVGNYNPRDYFKLMPEAGTPEDFRRYVAAAHRLGLRVWHDAVVHGGRSDSPRAVAHPEWVAWQRDGSKLPYWCFDQNWPSWAAYIGQYIETNTRDYSLDGWREDVPTGSRHPNWNPAIPYARASFAQNQGGFLMQRTIRAAARRANPCAATLAETHLGFYATMSDAIYDAKLCHEVFPKLRLMPPEEGARLLQRRFAEHRAVSVPGTRWMRYVESHDSLRAASAYGRAGTDALMALCAWTDGFPLVLEEGELSAYETWREIFRMRRETPALTTLAADYRSLVAPPGVFACVRGEGADRVAVLVNLNGTRTRGPVRGGGFDFTCDLPALGYDVHPLRPRRCAPLPAPCEGVAGEADSPVDYTVETNAAHEVVIRLPKATRWFADAADGTSGGPVRDHYPDFDSSFVPKFRCFHDKQDATCRWRSVFHPPGLVRAHATVGGTWSGGAVEISGFGPNDDVRICERYGSRAGLTVIAASVRPLEIRRCPAHVSPPVGTGDARLVPLVGGWRVETETRRVDICASGALIAASRRGASGWENLAARGGFVLDTKRAKHRILDQFSEVEAHQSLERLADGGLLLSFAGELREMSRGDGLLLKPVRYRTTLRCPVRGEMTYQTEFKPTRYYRKGEAELSWQADFLETSIKPRWTGKMDPRSRARENGGANFRWMSGHALDIKATDAPPGLELNL